METPALLPFYEENYTYCGQIWLEELDKFFSFGKQIFDTKVQVVSENDWWLIFDLDDGRPQYSLRLLFFPRKEDYWLNGKCWKTAWPLSNEFQVNSLPKITPPYSADNCLFQHRRPGFLEEFSDEEYHRVFESISRNRNLVCPKWYVMLDSNHGKSWC